MNINKETGGYTKTSISTPKYLFNKKCYHQCPSNTDADDENNVCNCKYAIHNHYGETTFYLDSDCISDYPYKNIDTNQCHSSLKIKKH